MPPKKGGKAGAKGKKNQQDDDEYWEQLAGKLKPQSPAPATTGTAAADDDSEPEVQLPRKSAFALPYDDVEVQEGDDDEGDDLMAILAKSKGGGKKDKKKKKDVEVDEDLAETRGVVEVGVDDWMEDEFGSSGKKEKKGGKKGKKGGAGKKVVEDEEDDDDQVAALTEKVQETKIVEETPAVASTPAATEGDNEGEEKEEEGATGGVLSKKEKERLKKEKEKAKKKAQAAAKKASAPTTSTPEVVSPPPAAPIADSSAPPTEEKDEDGDEVAGTAAGGKNKKKKKKPAAAATPSPAPAPKGKGGAQIAALRALVEAQKAAQEAQEKKEREERERIEAEDRRIEEEERIKAEEKARKKEKEKAKIERLRKEGKLLTPKQKADKAAAEIRREALLLTEGVTIAGLNKDPSASEGVEGGGGRKKVVYSKKKKGPTPVVASEAEKTVEEPVAVEEVVEAVIVEAKKEEEEDDDVKDSWDAESEEEEKNEDVKDDWDASDSEEEEKEPETVKEAPAPVKAAPASVKVATNGKPAATTPLVKPTVKSPPPISKSVPSKPAPAPAPKPAPGGKPTPATKGKAAATTVVESSSEEEESEGSGEDDSDSDDSDSDDSDDDSDDSDESGDGMTATKREEERRKAAAKERRLAKNAEALKARSKDNMRSPICVILGHVDTGKTKLLDKIRQTNVQEGEAGGITQQIGATYFPMEAIKSKTAVLGDADLKEYKLPGLLVIDTPGHESFTNLRTRGSSLCNIAILVVDIMHGLEPQTLESLRLLREGKTPFIVALNKIDRLYGWKPIPDGGFQDSLASQTKAVQQEFQTRLQQTILAFAEQGLNSLPYYENKDFARVVSLVPTSAHTGEGVPDMLMLIIKLTQERMTEKLMYLSTLECTVLEVKVIEGLGTTIDVVLSNGVLREGDRIVICGLNGAITTQVRALLTPQPMKELRIKGEYQHHKEVKASLGIKIVAPDLEKAIAGSRLLVLGEDDDEDELREEVMSDLTDLMNSVESRGVSVQASTLGSLEALLEFLRTSKIPVSAINIGPVHRKDVMRAASMLEKAKELSVILCFDVPVDKEAEKLADELGVKIFKADIIYHLFDAFKAYNAGIIEAKKADSAPKAVWPCRLKIIACFAKRDPIILGCDIIEGSLRVGTPLCVVRVDPETKKKDIISLGRVSSLEINHKVKDVVKKQEVGGGVAVKIEHAAYESAKQYGRHFDDKDEVIAMISRASIDVLKTHFREDVPKEDWILIKGLKQKLDIP